MCNYAHRAFTLAPHHDPGLCLVPFGHGVSTLGAFQHLGVLPETSFFCFPSLSADCLYRNLEWIDARQVFKYRAAVPSFLKVTVPQRRGGHPTITTFVFVAVHSRIVGETWASGETCDEREIDR